MGIMDVTAFLQNSTKCDSWSEIKASHKSAQSVELKLSEIYGMICLLSFGLFVATASFAVEKGVSLSHERQGSPPPSRIVIYPFEH